MKKLIAIILLISVLTISVSAAPEVSAPSCLLMDAATGTVLFEQNADEQLAPASVTKIMTLLLVMEAIDRGQLSWDDTITASAAAAAKGGSQIYLEENEQMTVREMVKCVVVSSANDCAAALAEAVSGSESAFVDLMNKRASELGMERTHFANCTGLDDEAGADVHYTTSRDIAIMSKALLAHEEIKEFTTIWMDTIRDGTFGLSNTNKLVRFYPDTTGLKTGFTSSAGYCMSATAKRNGMELIAAVMHCETSTDRFESAKALLEYGFATYMLEDPLGDEALPEIPVILGASDNAVLRLQDSSPMLLEKASGSDLSRQLDVAESLSAPVAAGQVVGSLTIRSGDRVLREIPVVAAEDIPKLSWGNLFSRLTRHLWMAD
ncbi:MAG: D-alanyl-D-alanine carboxypeptidase [Oscillospiraceae bacterium]|nr:D-alanyl-D-alanine carboxypeptidase [Oscillospiraceae bacterium]